ncbi:hypothetical protein [Pseudomonas guineae]|uniref:hypothetical protein n=1 Tax=Pseudomonas guineae TaxID=425504 RepID=UPI001113A123|nr:hypothetical protein [Pseudomonas guineae]
MVNEPNFNIEKRQEIARSLGFLTASELAILGGVKVTTIEAWRKRRQGPKYVQFGNEPLYPINGVKEFLDEMYSAIEGVKESARRHRVRAVL